MDLYTLALEARTPAARKFLTASSTAARELVAQFSDKKEIALEEIADGKPMNEIEHVIYGRIANFDELKEAASMESHEQWEVRIAKTDKNAGKGSIRVRKTVIAGGDPAYVITTKVPLNEDGDKLELALQSNADNFLQFKYLAEQGLIKNRYHFPIVGTDMVWEVDVFPKEGGGYHEWCKIDLEVKDRSAPIPELPITLEDIILPLGYGRQDEEAAGKLITKLYEDYFIAKNQFKDGTIEAEHPDPEKPAIHTGTEETPAQPTAPEAGDAPDLVGSPNEIPENMDQPTNGLDPNLPEELPEPSA